MCQERADNGPACSPLVIVTSPLSMLNYHLQCSTDTEPVSLPGWLLCSIRHRCVGTLAAFLRMVMPPTQTCPGAHHPLASSSTFLGLPAKGSMQGL